MELVGIRGTVTVFRYAFSVRVTIEAYCERVTIKRTYAPCIRAYIHLQKLSNPPILEREL